MQTPHLDASLLMSVNASVFDVTGAWLMSWYHAYEWVYNDHTTSCK